MLTPWVRTSEAGDRRNALACAPKCQTGRGCSHFALSSWQTPHGGDEINGRAEPGENRYRSLDPPRALRRFIPDREFSPHPASRGEENLTVIQSPCDGLRCGADGINGRAEPDAGRWPHGRTGKFSHKPIIPAGRLRPTFLDALRARTE